MPVSRSTLSYTAQQAALDCIGLYWTVWWQGALDCAFGFCHSEEALHQLLEPSATTTTIQALQALGDLQLEKGLLNTLVSLLGAAAVGLLVGPQQVKIRFGSGGWKMQRDHGGDAEEAIAKEIIELVKANDIDGLEDMLSSGVDPDSASSPSVETTHGPNGLIWASYLGGPFTARVLLDHGADPNYKYSHGSPLWYAAYSGNCAAVAALLAAGADPAELSGKENEKAIDKCMKAKAENGSAQMGDFDAVLQLLRAAEDGGLPGWSAVPRYVVWSIEAQDDHAQQDGPRRRGVVQVKQTADSAADSLGELGDGRVVEIVGEIDFDSNFVKVSTEFGVGFMPLENLVSLADPQAMEIGDTSLVVIAMEVDDTLLVVI